MKFLSWNIRGNTGVRDARWDRICTVLAGHEPDVVVLQEVPTEGPEVEDGLRTLGLGHVIRGAIRAGYGNVIAARWPLEALQSWFSGPRPSSATAALVHGTSGDFVAIAAHVPNGSGNGWVKIETFESLATAIHRIDLPVVLGGDFNEPKAVLEDGTVITFAMKQDKRGAWHMRGHLTGECGRSFPRARWARGVRSILGREPSVGLRHAHRVKRGPTTWHATHVVRGKERFFDHVLVSPDWKVLDCGFDDECRLDGTSDHSAAWAELDLRKTR